MVYGYRLVPDVSEPRTIGMLKEVEEELYRRTRSKPSDSCSSDEVNSCFSVEKHSASIVVKPLEPLFLIFTKSLIPEAYALAQYEFIRLLYNLGNTHITKQ
jgi:hypothetical protein